MARRFGGLSAQLRRKLRGFTNSESGQEPGTVLERRSQLTWLVSTAPPSAQARLVQQPVRGPVFSQHTPRVRPRDSSRRCAPALSARFARPEIPVDDALPLTVHQVRPGVAAPRRATSHSALLQGTPIDESPPGHSSVLIEGRHHALPTPFSIRMDSLHVHRPLLGCDLIGG